MKAPTGVLGLLKATKSEVYSHKHSPSSAEDAVGRTTEHALHIHFAFTLREKSCRTFKCRIGCWYSAHCKQQPLHKLDMWHASVRHESHFDALCACTAPSRRPCPPRPPTTGDPLVPLVSRVVFYVHPFGPGANSTQGLAPNLQGLGYLSGTPHAVSEPGQVALILNGRYE